jgi:hypothetical protein
MNETRSAGSIHPASHPVSALARPEPPPELHDRIVRAVYAETARARRQIKLRRCAIVGLATLCSFVAVAHSYMR